MKFIAIAALAVSAAAIRIPLPTVPATDSENVDFDNGYKQGQIDLLEDKLAAGKKALEMLKEEGYFIHTDIENGTYLVRFDA